MTLLDEIEALVKKHRSLEPAAPAPAPTPTPAPTPAPAPIVALKPSGPVSVTANGQVIEGLDITAPGTAISVGGFDGVTIRNCRISHNTGNQAVGHGIAATTADRLTIEDCEIINAGAPAKRAASSSSQININLDGASNVIIRRVTASRGSSGVYLHRCNGVSISDLEGYDFRGPMPRGQLVQFNQCFGPLSLDRFFYDGVQGQGFEEDILNCYASPGVKISNGVIAFAGDGTHGVGIMIENGSHDCAINNVEISKYWNGAFSSWNSNNTIYTNMKVRDVLATGTRGAASSNRLMAAFAGATTGCTAQAKHWNCNKANLLWEANKVSETFVEENWTPPVPRVRNAFSWRA